MVERDIVCLIEKRLLLSLQFNMEYFYLVENTSKLKFKGEKMTNSQKDYSNYLTRLARTSTKTIQELHSEKLVREVGRSYGLSENEMREVVENERN